MGRIVVGIDGSARSDVALQWAVEEARLRDVAVEAVYVYEDPPAWEGYAAAGERAPAAGFADEETLSPEDVRELRERLARAAGSARERARALAQQAVERLGEVGGISIEAVAVPDRRPARALVERSEGADMLVLGSRGRGGFAGLILGSVSQQCALHARCPVVIVRSDTHGG